MTRPSDHDIRNEPHLRGGPYRADPSERTARPSRPAASEADRANQSVWNEPSMSPELSGPTPEEPPTTARWLARRFADTSPARSWTVTAGVALTAGALAVVGALVQGVGYGGVVGIVLTGPIVEEVTKSAAALWVIERRPFLFRSPVQIMLCAVASGLAFAAIENLIYLNVYIVDPSPGIVWWRWTICTALHVTCTTIVGIGLVRLWQRARTHLRLPSLHEALPWLIAGIALHGLYNAGAVVLEVSGYRF